MYNINVKDKYKTFFVTYSNKENPDAQYYGSLWTAKTEVAVRCKIRDWLGSKYEIKRLEEIPRNIYVRLARLYNLKEQKDIEERKRNIKPGEGVKALETLLDVMATIQSLDPHNYYH